MSRDLQVESRHAGLDFYFNFRFAYKEFSLITNRILPGEPLNHQQMEQVLAHFYRDGYALIPGVLSSGEVEALREATDRCFADPLLKGTKYTGGSDGFVLRNTLELDPLFVDMLIREPILSLAKAIVGEDCKFCGQNVIRNDPGRPLQCGTWMTGLNFRSRMKSHATILECKCRCSGLPFRWH